MPSAEMIPKEAFNPKANPDIHPDRLERERKAEVERVERDGVWGVVGEFFDGEEWQHADSCFGFIGDDWKDSGYDVDIMASTLRQAKERACAELANAPLDRRW
jgi:hypothetical protein